MRRYSTRPVPKQVVSSTQCDGCGLVKEGEPDGWFTFSTGHHDWGNDSVEASEHFDACSANCFLKMGAKIAREYEPYAGQEPTLYALVGSLDFHMLNSLGRYRVDT